MDITKLTAKQLKDELAKRTKESETKKEEYKNLVSETKRSAAYFVEHCFVKIGHFRYLL